MSKEKKQETATDSADSNALRIEIMQTLTRRLPDMWDKYMAWIEKHDVAQGRWKPTFPHFIAWIKEYYGQE